MSANPLIDIPAIGAEAPGMGKISISLLIHLFTSIFPGSEIAGVPASEIKDTIFLSLRTSKNCALRWIKKH